MLLCHWIFWKTVRGLEQADPIDLPDTFVPLKAIAPTKAWKETRKLNLSLANEMGAGGKSDPVPVMELLQQQTPGSSDF